MMSESEWLAATHPAYMLVHLYGTASKRKRCLFAAACCRRLESLLAHHPDLEAVHQLGGFLAMAERYPEWIGRPQAWVDDAWWAEQTEYESAIPRLVDVAESANAFATGYSYAAFAIADVMSEPPQGWGRLRKRQGQEDHFSNCDGACDNAARAVGFYTASRAGAGWSPDGHEESAELSFPAFFAPERAAQAALLRDVIGNPFRPAAIDPAWLAAKGGAVPALAGDIYLGRAFDRLPELAGALEAAGCDQVEILAHCRGPGPHVRGCWVVDALLGKS